MILLAFTKESGTVLTVIFWPLQGAPQKLDANFQKEMNEQNKLKNQIMRRLFVGPRSEKDSGGPFGVFSKIFDKLKRKKLMEVKYVVHVMSESGDHFHVKIYDEVWPLDEIKQLMVLEKYEPAISFEEDEGKGPGIAGSWFHIMDVTII